MNLLENLGLVEYLRGGVVSLNLTGLWLEVSEM